jgi:hypothetical protein
MKAIVLGTLVFFWSVVAWADILAWQDADGVRHYTNLKAAVPKQHQDSVQVVVDELARQPEKTGVAESAPPQAVVPQPHAPAPEAAVVYDRAGVRGAYVDGLLRGLEIARGGGGGGGGGGGVQLNGPLAVATTTGSGLYPPYLFPYYYPLVTTGFDRGRSRYLTLRMLLEDQFQIDRGGPFVFVERLVPPFGHPPLSVDLNPILPRGLPYSAPIQARVITQ